MKSGILPVAATAYLVGVASALVLTRRTGEPPRAAAAQAAPRPAAPAATWLHGTADEKLVQVERQLRGFDVTMAEVGYRYDQLVAAAKSRNWDYAQYQTEKIEHAIRLGLERRPKRAKSAQPFLEGSIPPLSAAIKSRNAERLDGAVQSLHKGCIQCHRAENVLYMGGRFAALHPTSAATSQAVANYLRLLTPEYLAAADRSQGRLVFARHCANCHRLFEEGSATGPDLTHLQRSNVEYLLKTIVDPNALVGFDYQTVIIATRDGRTIFGLVTREDEKSFELQTATASVTIPKDEIEEQSTSSVSVMPEGLLQNLSDEQVRDLIGYLQGTEQPPLPKAGNGEDAGQSPPLETMPGGARNAGSSAARATITSLRQGWHDGGPGRHRSRGARLQPAHRQRAPARPVAGRSARLPPPGAGGTALWYTSIPGGRHGGANRCTPGALRRSQPVPLSSRHFLVSR